MAKGWKILLLILRDLMNNNFIGQDVKENFCLKAVTKIYLLNSFIEIKGMYEKVHLFKLSN